MSPLDTWILAVSLAAFSVISTYWFLRERQLVRLILDFLALVLAFVVLRELFGFPVIAQAKSGSNWRDAYQIIGLFIAMLLGMLAQYAYAHFSEPKPTRKIFDWGAFIAPVFLSPIVFIPLFETLKTAPAQGQASTMLLLIAFENGFFFKNYVDQRRTSPSKDIQV